MNIDIKELKTLAITYAQNVDAKSQHTAEHSIGVANLSTHLAEACGMDEETCFKIEIAGLLHDLGKLEMPDKILECNGSLDNDDQAVMRHHSFITFQLLKNINGLEDIASWAGNHHEKLDGSGYPLGKTAQELDTASRIIAIADIFQALAQNRPYRLALPLATIMEYLQEEVAKGQIDAEIVGIIEQDREKFYAIASDST